MPDEIWDDVRLTLCDPRDDVIAAWRRVFELKYPEVEIRQGDALEADSDALLLPGNAYGFLDRGLELSCCEAFGWELQDHLRERVREDFFGELLVGQACFAPTGRDGPPRTIVYAPIYRTPRKLEGSLNVYLAVRGALLAMRRGEGPDGVRTLTVTGLGTGGASLHPAVSARQLRYAWEIATGRRGFGDKNISQLRRREAKLRSVPRSVLEAEAAEAAEGAPDASEE